MCWKRYRAPRAHPMSDRARHMLTPWARGHTGGVRCTAVATGFRHEALFYAGDAGFMAGIVPFAREALAAEAAILIAVSARRIALLRDALGADAEGIAFIDMAELGRNPGRIIAAWHDFAESHEATGAPLYGVGEPIWSGRSEDELVECHRHEALLNLAFADAADFRLVCPYDMSALDPATLAEAACTHPRLLDHAGLHESASYAGNAQIAKPFDAPLSTPPPYADAIEFDGATLSAVRDLAGRYADAAGLDEERGHDLVLAVNEVATNSVRHASGQGTLRLWREPDALVCEVRDDGRIEDPLVGRARPAPQHFGGYGLWLVNQVCDLVELRAGQDGTTVRMHMGSSRNP
jgi:anti-sigma regulatory factor (Ser/Thr protein kinase)